jgi:hypothetical protein
MGLLALPLSALSAASKARLSLATLALVMTAAMASASSWSAASVGWLANRKFRHCASWYRLALAARQRGSNQRPSYWTFVTHGRAVFRYLEAAGVGVS